MISGSQPAMVGRQGSERLGYADCWETRKGQEGKVTVHAKKVNTHTHTHAFTHAFI